MNKLRRRLAGAVFGGILGVVAGYGINEMSSGQETRPACAGAAAEAGVLACAQAVKAPEPHEFDGRVLEMVLGTIGAGAGLAGANWLVKNQQLTTELNELLHGRVPEVHKHEQS